jgi:hypothetical protein
MRRLSAIVVAMALASTAHAEGPGIKLGEALVLHPGVALGLGYDTNLFYSSDTPGDPATGVAYIAVRPAVDLATLSAQRGGGTPHTLDFRLHMGADVRALLSGDSSVNQHWSVNLESGMVLALFPFGNYALDLFNNYVRSSVPPYNVTRTSDNINSDQNQLGLRLKLRPGGQRLEIAVQYMFAFYLFEGGLFSDKNDLINSFQLRVSWKFFPKTALYLQASEDINSYITQGGATPPTAFPFRVVLGVIGLITAKLSVNANIGYANSFTQSNANQPNAASYNMVIGLIEGTWKPTLTTSVSLGYRHDFVQALIGTFYELISVGDDLEKNFSNCVLLGPTPVPCSYFRDDVWLRLGVAY